MEGKTVTNPSLESQLQSVYDEIAKIRGELKARFDVLAFKLNIAGENRNSREELLTFSNLEQKFILLTSDFGELEKQCIKRYKRVLQNPPL